MDLRYPIGPYAPPAALTPETRAAYIDDLDVFPALLRAAVDGLPDDRLDTPYRPGGWTLRQVVHHVADSHSHALIRFKWALTEDEPRIKSYNQDAHAGLPDVHAVPVATVLALVDAVHARWTGLLRALPDDEAVWGRAILHPDRGRLTLDDMLPHYAWHGRHHLAHITSAVEREG